VTTTKARKKPNGSVALVAAGPGDPDLLTLRAASLLREAEYIVVDADAAEVAAVHASPDAEVVIAVNASGLPLEHIERAKLVIDAAKEGKRRVITDPGSDAIPAPHVTPGPAKHVVHA
jgi:siroheme synthase